jgi:hypothetical protein
MSDPTDPSAIKPFWRRSLAGILDFLTVFFIGGYAIAYFSGEIASDGFNLTGLPALVLVAVLVLYFYLGWNRLGGTIWQRILRAR